MRNRRTFIAAASTLIAAFAAPTVALAKEPIPVVASFSILGDMVERIGGLHVALTTLVGPGGDTHVYQPTPADARAVKNADVLFINGLEFEGWLNRLAEAAEFDGALVAATTGVDAIPYGDEDEGHDDEEHGDHGHDDHADEKHDDHDHQDHAKKDHDDDHADHGHGDDHHDKHAGHDDHHGDEHAGHDHGAFDPHAWHSVANAVIYVDNITAALAKAAPEHAAAFYQNRAKYVAELEALDAEVRAVIDRLPPEKRTVVTSHDAFQYFGRDYGLTFVSPQGLSTESDPSAADVAEMITQIREDGISAIFVEAISDNRMLERIASETGATIGGTLFPGALSGPDGPASTYVDLIRHNATTLTSALGS